METNYTIEKNIPFEKKEKSVLRKTMESMEVWDSFYMNTMTEYNSAGYIKYRIKWREFAVKKWEEWFRCWRKS